METIIYFMQVTLGIIAGAALSVVATLIILIVAVIVIWYLFD